MPVIISVLSGFGTFAVIFGWLILLSTRDDNFIFFRIAGYLLPGDEKPGSGAFRFPLGWLLIFFVSVLAGIAMTLLIMYLKKKL